MTLTKSLLSCGLIVLLSFLLLVSSYQLCVVLMHDLLKQELQSWQGRDYSLASYERWQDQQAMVNLLHKLAPYHGEILQSSSRFHQLGSRIAAASTEHQQSAPQHQQQAAQLIRQSLLHQPSWPLAWMDLAFIKSSQQLFDPEFQQAFLQAIETGAAEEYVLLGMTEIGLAYWRDLSVENRKNFLHFLELAIVREPQHVITNAEYYRRSYVVCRLVANNSLLEAYCANQ